jgi:hypothetical protein
LGIRIRILIRSDPDLFEESGSKFLITKSESRSGSDLEN